MRIRFVALTTLAFLALTSSAFAGAMNGTKMNGINMTGSGIQKNLRVTTKSTVISHKALRLISVDMNRVRS